MNESLIIIKLNSRQRRTLLVLQKHFRQIFFFTFTFVTTLRIIEYKIDIILQYYRISKKSYYTQ